MKILLKTNGEEVIPCQYDFVRLPSEGICAVYDKDGHLGYWSLDENCEVVAQKYVPLKDNKMACITYKKGLTLPSIYIQDLCLQQPARWLGIIPLDITHLRTVIQL